MLQLDPAAPADAQQAEAALLLTTGYDSAWRSGTSLCFSCNIEHLTIAFMDIFLYTHISNKFIFHIWYKEIYIAKIVPAKSFQI